MFHLLSCVEKVNVYNINSAENNNSIEKLEYFFTSLSLAYMLVNHKNNNINFFLATFNFFALKDILKYELMFNLFTLIFTSFLSNKKIETKYKQFNLSST